MIYLKGMKKEMMLSQVILCKILVKKYITCFIGGKNLRLLYVCIFFDIYLLSEQSFIPEWLKAELEVI